MTLATITNKLAVGDIIEIVRHDERCRMNLRRVRIVSVQTKHNRHEVIASNLKGENAWDYRLPLNSWSEVITEAGNIGWFPFVDDPEFEA